MPTAEGLPSEVAELKMELTGLLPFAPIASVLVERRRNQQAAGVHIRWFFGGWTVYPRP